MPYCCDNYVILSILDCADVGIFGSCMIVLTYRAEKKILSPDHERVLKYKLSVAFGETWEDRGGEENLKRQIKKFKNMVIQCCENDKLVSY